MALEATRRRRTLERQQLNAHSNAGRAALAGAILYCLFIAVAGELKAEDTKAGGTTSEIRIAEIQGKVEISLANATAWSLAQTNQSLHSFDRLLTGAESRVALRWSDQTVLYFDASTEIEVLPPDSPNALSGLHLVRGIVSFFHRDQPSRIRVITPGRGRVSGVEGTEFVLAVNEWRGSHHIVSN